MHALKEQMLELLQQRGAQYPAEHNVGHLYKAPETLQKFYRENDPTNSMNPGSVKPVSGKTGRKWSNNYGWQSIAIRHSFNRSVPSAPPPPFGRLFVFIAQRCCRNRHHFTGFNPGTQAAGIGKMGIFAKRVHHYQRHRFIIDNRAHHQTMARRIGKTGFG